MIDAKTVDIRSNEQINKNANMQYIEYINNQTTLDNTTALTEADDDLTAAINGANT